MGEICFDKIFLIFFFYRLRNGLKFSRVLELPEVRISNAPIFSTNHHVKVHCDV